MPGENLELVDFTACSGATTEDVLGQPDPSDPNDRTGIWNEPAQVNALNSKTDVVTISIGGNDIGFGEFANACVISECDTSTSIYLDTRDNIELDLHAKLYQVYQDILDKAPNAKVYVVGYADLAPDADAGNMPVQCLYFNSSVGLGDDARAAKLIVGKLNSVINDAVVAVESDAENQGRIAFIDPNSSVAGNFHLHDVCSSAPYFHNVTPNDAIGNGYRERIFHPNIDGHYEYAAIVADEIS